MTPDEIVCEIFNRQGFIIARDREPMPEPGTVFMEWNSEKEGQPTTPIRVVGPATREEYERQNSLWRAIVLASGEPDPTPPVTDPAYRYFYRVEALD